jgi:hypothetical protein
MVIETTLKYCLRRLTEAFRHFASTRHWGPEDYQVFVRLNLDWGAIHLILVARAFPATDGENPWLTVHQFLEHEFKDDRPLFESLHFVVRTYDQVEEGGTNGIPHSYEDLNDLVVARPDSGR